MKKQPFLGPSDIPAENPNLISTTIKRQVNRRKGKLNDLHRDEKLLCALRKALASKSDGAVHYYIASDKLYVAKRGGGNQTKPGEAVSYTAAGRFQMGGIRADKVTYNMAEFNLTFRDTVDERGLPDVEFLEPSIINMLPRGASLVP